MIGNFSDTLVERVRLHTVTQALLEIKFLYKRCTKYTARWD
jgi:hypothetical protein